MRIVMFLFVLMCMAIKPQAQSFPHSWQGHWSGDMIITQGNSPVDSIPIHFDIATLTDSTWTWKMTYLGDSIMVKDYVLKSRNIAAGQFVVDEGEGIVLSCLYLQDRLYCTFTVGEMIIQALYSRAGDRLIFEVFSAIPQGAAMPYEVGDARVVNIQRAELLRN